MEGRFLVAGATALAVVLSACASDVDTPRAQPSPSLPSASPTPAGPPTEVQDGANLVAHATVKKLPIFRSRFTAKPFVRLANPTPVGAPLVFLVAREAGEWLNVLLPLRPNGSKGWIRTQDVKLLQHRFHVEVRIGAHRIVVRDGDEVVLKAPIGVGTQDTPTPGGLFYIKELLKPPDPNTLYGPYAYGLSGFSNKLTSFAGGEGVIGIHGTNDPSTIGRDVSHGCIRLYNKDIKKLVPILPLGTPVRILK